MREWWIYDGEYPNMAFDSPSDKRIHAIEKSSYDELQQELAKAKQETEIWKHEHRTNGMAIQELMREREKSTQLQIAVDKAIDLISQERKKSVELLTTLEKCTFIQGCGACWSNQAAQNETLIKYKKSRI